MARWTRVKWTEAGQVADLSEADKAGLAPEAYFDSLRAAGRLTDAAMFLGLALPRHETVAWAARAVRDLPNPEGRREDAEALKAALLWVQDPSETRRRAAFDAGQAASDQSAEQMAAFAAFFSGGSMAPEGYEPIQPPMDSAGTFAGGAVVIAAVRTGDMETALIKSLDAGDRIAEKGLAADA